MKKTVNLSLDHKVVNLLATLAGKYSVSKTKIMEEAIEEFAEKKARERNKIMSFAGALKKDDGLAMLKSIKEDRVNKKWS